MSSERSSIQYSTRRLARHWGSVISAATEAEHTRSVLRAQCHMANVPLREQCPLLEGIAPWVRPPLEDALHLCHILGYKIRGFRILAQNYKHMNV